MGVFGIPSMHQTLFAFNSTYGDRRLPSGDENLSPQILPPRALLLFGRTYPSLYVHTNGLIIFDDHIDNDVITPKDDNIDDEDRQLMTVQCYN